MTRRPARAGGCGLPLAPGGDAAQAGIRRRGAGSRQVPGLRSGFATLDFRGAPAAAVAVLIAAGCAGERRETATSPVRRGPFEVTTVLTGELSALRSLTISGPVHGQIEFIAREHIVVRKGDVIARLDTAELETRLLGLKEELAGAAKRLVEAERDLEVGRAQAAVELDRKRAALALAEVAHQKVMAGADPLDVSVAEKELEAARAGCSLAEDAHANAVSLAARGFATKAELDRSELALMRAKVRSRRAELALREFRSRPDAEESALSGLVVEEAALAVEMAAVESARRVGSLEQAVAWARGDAASLRERIRRVEDDIARSTVRAPRDGIAIPATGFRREKVEAGSRAVPGIAMLTLPDLSAFKVTVFIPEAAMRHFALADAVKVSVDDIEGVEFAGSIVWIDQWARDRNEELGTADRKREGLSGVRVFKAHVAMDGVHESMRIGSRATVTRSHTVPDVLSVARGCIWTCGGRSYVTVLQPDGSGRAVEVLPLDESGGMVAVAGALTASDSVAVGHAE